MRFFGIIQNNLNYAKRNNCQYNNYQNNDNYINKIDFGILNNNIKNINSSQNNIMPNNTEMNQINNLNNIIIPNNILSRNLGYKDFLNYVSTLKTPLIKFLCTKKGISEMENYLNNHRKNNIEIMIYFNISNFCRDF